MSGGKTREAKARRKMSENSLSKPPIPIRSKFQSGLMMDCREPRVFALPGGTSNKHKHSKLASLILILITNQTSAETSLSKKIWRKSFHQSQTKHESGLPPCGSDQTVHPETCSSSEELQIYRFTTILKGREKVKERKVFCVFCRVFGV